ncbi:tyrosinase, partial [Streptomyces albus subsp. albus]
TAAEKKAFVDAVLEVKRLGVYDEFVLAHRTRFSIDMNTGVYVGHFGPSFLPWHRKFLIDFENELRKVDASVSIPYWDWTQDNRPTSSLWAEDFLGGNGRTGDRQVTTGAFAYGAGNWSVGRGVTDEHYLTRNFGRPGSNPVSLPTGDDLARALKDPVYDTEPWNSVCTQGFRNRVEGWGIRGVRSVGLHNRVHQWVGGPMAGAASPEDPVFWLHHSFIDLIWDRWRTAHPKSAYVPGRKPADPGPERD